VVVDILLVQTVKIMSARKSRVQGSVAHSIVIASIVGEVNA